MTNAQLFEAGMWWLGICGVLLIVFAVLLAYDDRKYGRVYDQFEDEA